MIRPFVILAIVGLAATFAGCATPQTVHAPARTNTVLAIDFLRTLPGEQSDYLEFVRLNWMQARAIAVEVGAVVRYEVLVRDPGEEMWDVMLVTEYANQSAYEDREAIFARIFDRPDFIEKPVNGKGPRDMAEFVGGEVSVSRFAP